MNKYINHLELFAGIGGFRRAIDLLAKDLGYSSKCIGFSELDKYAVSSYKENYDTSEEVFMGDIEEFVSKEENVCSLKDFDLLTGGFPCQAFSMMGKQLGFEDKRGNLFYSIIDILKIKKPKYVLLENVKNLKNHDQGNTYLKIKETLEIEGGYDVYDSIFNTSNFGLPQTRRRIFIFGIRKDLLKKDVDFNEEIIIEHFKSIKNTSLNKYTDVLDILDKNVDDKYYLSEKIKPTILSNGSKNFNSNSEINQLIARPLTATMVKMHRACQDNYYSDLFLDDEDPYNYLTNKFTKEELAKHSIRKLTPWEALKLQGFDAQFYENSSKAKISNHQIYKQAGNAVSVNVVYAILRFLLDENIIDI